MEIVVFLYHILNLSLMSAFVSIVSTVLILAPTYGIVYLVMLGGVFLYFIGHYQKQPWRFLFLLWLPLGGLLCANWVDFMVLAIVGLYSVVVAIRKPLVLDYTELKDRYFSQLKVLPLLVLFAPGAERLKQSILTIFVLALICFLSTVYALRILRVGSEMMESKDFKLMNLRSIISLGFSIAIFCNAYSIKIFTTIISGLYFGIVVPVIKIPLFLFSVLIGTVFNVRALPSKDETETLSDLMFKKTIQLQGMDELKDRELKFSLEMMQRFAVIFGVILIAVVVLYIIFKKNMEKGPDDVEQTYVRIESKEIDVEPKKKFWERFVPKNNNDQVRELYRKLIKKCRNNAVNITEYMDSLQIDYAAGGTSHTHALREIYVKARYGEQPVSKEEVQTAKEIYSKIQMYKDQIEE